MGWLSRNAAPVEAAAAVVTALVALAALVGVAWQLAAADELAREQSARDAYRAHLTLAVAHPDLADPGDGACALLATGKAVAYEAFVEHLLYAAEQMLEVAEGWEPTFLYQAQPHAAYLCGVDAPIGATRETLAMLIRFRAAQCQKVQPCRPD